VLCVSHIQVDEKVNRELFSYETKIERAVHVLSDMGLETRLESTAVGVYDTSRYGMSRYGGDDENALYDALVRLVSKCNQAAGKKADATRDAIIGVSALDHDLFITCDRCLSQGFQSAIATYARLQNRLPKLILSKTITEDVAKTIMNCT